MLDVGSRRYRLSANLVIDAALILVIGSGDHEGNAPLVTSDGQGAHTATCGIGFIHPVALGALGGNGDSCRATLQQRTPTPSEQNPALTVSILGAVSLYVCDVGKEHMMGLREVLAIKRTEADGTCRSTYLGREDACCVLTLRGIDSAHTFGIEPEHACILIELQMMVLLGISSEEEAYGGAVRGL